MQRITLAVTTGFTVFAATTALASDLGPLITPAELSETSENPILLDVRDVGYDAGHIEGAVTAPYSLFRGPSNNPGEVPPVEQLEATYEDLGLALDRPVVIVSQGDTDTDFGAAARVYWTLKSSGFTNLSVLNGGAIGWVNAGLPVSRPTAFFEGNQAHPAASRPGTLPGAQSLPYTEFFRPGATAIGNDTDVAALKAKLQIEEGDAVVSFCNTGHWAATNWFAMSELAGIQDVKLYPGSMVEYSQTDGKMANQPGLIANFLNQITGGN
mgnify:CR=1 FL=1